MKQFLKTIALHTVLTAISGVILISLIFIGMIIWESKKYGAPIEGAVFFKNTINVNSKAELDQDLEIVELEYLKDMENFTIKGKIKNKSEKTYFSFYVTLEYAVEGIKMGECSEYVAESTNLKQNESIGFLVDCYGFKPRKLPSQFSYAVNVMSARRYKDD